MSAHDRGAFGQLLAEAKSLAVHRLQFEVDLHASDETTYRWVVTTNPPSLGGNGRTGEEALRAFVEALRVARNAESR